MNWVRTVVREAIALFIDDGSFALAIAIWLAAVAALAWWATAARPWAGWLLFGGLAAILVESVRRRAGKH